MGYVKILIASVVLCAGCAVDPCKQAANYQAPQHIDKPYQAGQAQMQKHAASECKMAIDAARNNC